MKEWKDKNEVVFLLESSKETTHLPLLAGNRVTIFTIAVQKVCRNLTFIHSKLIDFIEVSI